MSKHWTEQEAVLAYSISQNLKYIMRFENIGRKELSRRTGISTSMIGEYMLGRSLPSYERIEALANGLNCDVSEITAEYDHRPPGHID